MDKNKLKSEKIALIAIIVLFAGIFSYALIINKSNPTPVSIPSCPPTVTDIDGNIYKTVIIGDQCWMKENLKVTKNPEGKDIARYCYDNDPKICETDGGLYNWNTTMNNSIEEGAQGICPNGWHVPTDLEWYTLENGLATDNCIDGLKYPLQALSNRCNPAGTKLQKGGESGFEGVLAGSFRTRGLLGYYWTSTENAFEVTRGQDKIKPTAYYRVLNATKATVDHGFIDKNDSNFSLRCIKD
jgi:uncharacterized protein (TIGR02145 family)